MLASALKIGLSAEYFDKSTPFDFINLLSEYTASDEEKESTKRTATPMEVANFIK